MNRLAPVLWLVFAAVILVGGAVLLRACGVLPWGINACPVPPPPSAASIAAARRDDLARERDLLLQTANLAPQCRIPAAAEPPPPEPEPEPEQAANCQPRATEEVVVLLDVSASMRYDFEPDPAIITRHDELNEIAQRSGLSPRQERELFDLIRRLDASTGRDRIDVAKDALIELGRNTPPGVDLNLLTFAQCGRPPRQEGVFASGPGGGFEEAVRGVRLRSATALAEAIAALPQSTAAGRTPDQPVNIIIVSDGQDSCRGDPCAAARQMKAELPYAQVSVISLAEAANANACVAEGAEGAFYYAADIEELARRMRQATGQLSADECAALGSEAAGAAPSEGDQTK